jgi:serine/threonine protein kinase
MNYIFSRNILLDEFDAVKLGDLGLTRKIEKGGMSETAIMGTLNYMSPEAIRGEQVDYKSDIWSFGCVLYVLLFL